MAQPQGLLCYKGDCMKKVIISCLVTAVLCAVAAIIGAGYFVGNYAVHFGLERGTAENPQEPPRAYALLMPPEARTYTRPDYPSEEWELRSPDGLRLVATHFRPGTRGEHRRWAIVVHGYGCTQQNSWYIAANYLAMGYEVLTPDLRAAGGSEGRYLTMGYKESEDVLLWAERIAREHPDAEILLHGVSMGAATVMMAAGDSRLSPNVVACVEDCGYTSAYDIIAYQIEQSFGLPSFPALELLDWRCERIAGFSLHRAAPGEAVQHARVPMLFIHGTRDTLVPSYMAQQLYDEAQAPAKQLLYIDGANHAAASQQDQQKYFQTIEEFVRPYME